MGRVSQLYSCFIERKWGRKELTRKRQSLFIKGLLYPTNCHLCYEKKMGLTKILMLLWSKKYKEHGWWQWLRVLSQWAEFEEPIVISLPQCAALLICLQTRQIHWLKQDVGKESYMKLAGPEMSSVVWAAALRQPQAGSVSNTYFQAPSPRDAAQ